MERRQCRLHTSRAHLVGTYMQDGHRLALLLQCDRHPAGVRGFGSVGGHDARCLRLQRARHGRDQQWCRDQAQQPSRGKHRASAVPQQRTLPNGDRNMAIRSECRIHIGRHRLHLPAITSAAGRSHARSRGRRRGGLPAPGAAAALGATAPAGRAGGVQGRRQRGARLRQEGGAEEAEERQGRSGCARRAWRTDGADPDAERVAGRGRTDGRVRLPREGRARPPPRRRARRDATSKQDGANAGGARPAEPRGGRDARGGVAAHAPPRRPLRRPPRLRLGRPLRGLLLCKHAVSERPCEPGPPQTLTLTLALTPQPSPRP
eukprot:scaffold16490_cov73-Phaeocystis_antarctica.AAC.10